MGPSLCRRFSCLGVVFSVWPLGAAGRAFTKQMDPGRAPGAGGAQGPVGDGAGGPAEPLSQVWGRDVDKPR